MHSLMVTLYNMGIIPFFYNRNSNQKKIFVIGFNKTGTTSLKKLFRDFGFKVANQRVQELVLYKPYLSDDFDAIKKFCNMNFFKISLSHRLIFIKKFIVNFLMQNLY